MSEPTQRVVSWRVARATADAIMSEALPEIAAAYGDNYAYQVVLGAAIDRIGRVLGLLGWTEPDLRAEITMRETNRQN